MRQNLQSTQGNAKPRMSAKITSERNHSQGITNYTIKKGILNNFGFAKFAVFLKNIFCEKFLFTTFDVNTVVGK